MLNSDVSSIVYRYVTKHEENQALEIWCSIFNNPVDLEERYISSSASPYYKQGDTLGAWLNDELLSTVHIRRLILESNEDGRQYVCAGITNVATRDEYRRRVSDLSYEDKGYVIIGNPENEEDVGVVEWRTSNFDHEQKLLSLAANKIQQRYGLTKRIQLFTLPQYMTIEQLTNWAGPVQIGTNYDIMMRNIRLPPEIYEQIKTSFSNGHAVFWSGDYF
ncbi:unnamed protein product [Adineta ricciae]|uniref:Uncharacterized protein n=1 Tax=Adineta ricciae TaxID=249248 RepID=A0A815CC22_ADIRI|nr:unnamed protein product [Adineta ricciae]CAF1303419.1 unnamed protein product [Adineta ricciae]